MSSWFENYNNHLSRPEHALRQRKFTRPTWCCVPTVIQQHGKRIGYTTHKLTRLVLCGVSTELKHYVSPEELSTAGALRLADLVSLPVHWSGTRPTLTAKQLRPLLVVIATFGIITSPSRRGSCPCPCDGSGSVQE